MTVNVTTVSTTTSVPVRIFEHDFDFYTSDDYEERA